MMHRRPLFFSLLLAALCSTAQAAPQIVIYNFYTPPPPLEVTGVVPQDHQEYTTGGPGQVEVSFSQNIAVDRSDVKAYDPYNNPLPGTKTFSNNNKMVLSLPGHLLAGTYRVEWTATCACAAATVLTGKSYFVVD